MKKHDLDNIKKTAKELHRFLIQAVHKCFDEYEDVITFELKKRLVEYTQSYRVKNIADNYQSKEDGWISIISLSHLRQLVGGRFANLKNRWLKAGFPLKEKKGSKIPKYCVNDEGWRDLTSWLAKQGYEARLPKDKEKEDGLFLIKKAS